MFCHDSAVYDVLQHDLAEVLTEVAHKGKVWEWNAHMNYLLAVKEGKAPCHIACNSLAPA